MTPVDEFLEQRSGRKSVWQRLASLLSSLALHAALLATALLVPGLFAQESKPVEYVPVMLVPPPAVGVERPAPSPPPETPEPEPEPEPEEPESEAPVLPQDETEPEEPPEDEPEPKPVPEPRREEPALPGPEGSPEGDPGSSFTQGASVLGVEDPSFTYGYYLDRLVVSIKEQWVRPHLGSGIEVVVHFRIEKDGSIRDVRVSRSSGYNSFDLAALRAVHSAAPLPPLPRSYPKRSLGVNLIFR